MKTQIITIAALLSGCAALAQQQPAAATSGPAPTERCKVVLAAAQGAQEQRVSEIRAQEQRAAQRAREAASCLSRAGDSIVRAAIPPSLGQVFGAVSDPGGYIQNATSNAACNVVTNEAAKGARGYSDLNGAVMRQGGAIDQVLRGGVDDALGGKGQTYGQYTGQKTDSGFWQSLTCRLYGRC